jgi:hypothetical protein
MERKSNFLFINCEEATHICDKSQYNEASWRQILKLKFHMMYCKFCKKYTKGNSKLTTLCSQAKLKTLTSQEKQKIKKVLDSEIAK